MTDGRKPSTWWSRRKRPATARGSNSTERQLEYMAAKADKTINPHSDADADSAGNGIDYDLLNGKVKIKPINPPPASRVLSGSRGRPPRGRYFRG